MKIEKGELIIDILELVASMDDAQQNEVGKFIGAQERLFEAVVGALSDPSGWFYEDDGLWWLDETFMSRLRQRLVPMMDTVAANEIGSLNRRLSTAEEHRDEYMREMVELKRGTWNHDCRLREAEAEADQARKQVQMLKLELKAEIERRRQ